MKGIVVSSLAGVVAAATLMAGAARSLPLAQSRATGTIRGHVRLNGRAPGNAGIRMGKDPKCADMNKGKQIIQETVKATLDGSLANVFVHLEGALPGSAVPKSPVVINQHGCFYEPRVNVPPGTYTIDAWQERFGPQKRTVKVTGGATATVDFSYSGTQPERR